MWDIIRGCREQGWLPPNDRRRLQGGSVTALIGPTSHHTWGVQYGKGGLFFNAQLRLTDYGRKRVSLCGTYDGLSWKSAFQIAPMWQCVEGKLAATNCWLHTTPSHFQWLTSYGLGYGRSVLRGLRSANWDPMVRVPTTHFRPAIPGMIQSHGKVHMRRLGNGVGYDPNKFPLPPFLQTQHLVYVARNYIFSLIWRCYSPKRDILDYWGKIIYCLLSYYILSKDKGLYGWKNGYGKIPLEQQCHWEESHIHKYYGTYCTR